jgi:hypothetical protein
MSSQEMKSKAAKIFNHVNSSKVDKEASCIGSIAG